ncbi:MAG: aldehyde dehydrogenase family protein, partial [Methanobrevibacter sp.]|nr:aldehyde dehydrogenase family protein [Methanobrevibacter sp.]
MSVKYEASKHEELANKLEDIKLYINGEFVDAEDKGTFDNISPFTNEKMNNIASGQAADIDKAVQSAKKAFKGEWGNLKQAERLEYVYKIGDLIEQHTD